MMIVSRLFAAVVAVLAFAGALSPAIAGADFTLEDVAVISGGTSYRAKLLEITDSALSRDEMQALLTDAATPAPQRWGKVTAARISAPEIVSDTTGGAASQTITYRDLVLEEIVEGKIARARAAGATVSIKGPETGDIAAQTGAVLLENVDLPALAHMLVEGRNSADEEPRVVVGTGRVDDVAMELPKGARGRIGSVLLRDAGGRALAVPMASLVDLTPKPDATPPGPERRQALSGLFADLLTSQSIGSLTLQDVTLRGPPPDMTSITLAGLTVDGVRSGRIAGLKLEGLSVADKDGANTASVARVSIGGFDLTPVLSASLANAGPARVPMKFDKLELERMSLTIPRVGQPTALTVARGSVDALKWRDGAPRDVSIRIDQVAFDLPTDEPRVRPLLDLGYARLDLSFATSSSYDEDKREVLLRTMKLSAQDAGTVELTGLLANIGPGILSTDREKAYAAFASGLFKSAGSTVIDDGLLNRLIETQARQTGSTAAAVRARWAAGVRAAVTAFLADNADRGAIADAAERFILSGGRLALSAEAPNGLGLVDAVLAGGWQGLLGKVKLTVSR